MPRGGLGQHRQPGHPRAFLQPCAHRQAKPQAFRRNPSLRQKPDNMRRLCPAFRAQPMIRDQRHQPATPRRHPIPREQGKRQAMRPARDSHSKPRRRAERAKRRHGGGEFRPADR
jgi:hypothetical protein